MQLAGHLIIEGIGEITISDRRSLELARQLLNYTLRRSQVKYYCDKCHKKELDEFVLVIHRQERYVSADWHRPENITAYCLDCWNAAKPKEGTA